jgi:hypothetical protein
MTILRVAGFGGIIPRLGKRLLPDSNAQYALNSKLFSGELRSWQEPALLATFASHPLLKDVYHYRHFGSLVDYYIPFDRRTDVVKAPIINDAYGRLYWTDGVQFTITTMSDVEAAIPGQPVGVPAPTFGTPITIVPSGGTSTTSETRVYTVILVSKYGEEGPPDVASTVTVSGKIDDTYTVANLDTLITAGLNPNMQKLRLYRTITTDDGSVQYRQVQEWDIGSIPASYDDNVPATTVATNPALQSLTWTAPPTDLQGLCAGPGGMLSAFKGRTVYFSFPYYPHAWPQEYQLATVDDIVSMGWVGSMLVVGTTGRPVVIQGTSPTSLSLEQFGEVIPCMSRDGFVATSVTCFYPSLDGLMSIGPDGVNNVTNEFATRQDWLDGFDPANISGAIYQSRYFGFYSTQLGFSLGFDDATTGLTQLQYDGITRIKNSAVDNSAHMIVGNKLYQWDAVVDQPLLYVWRTKPFMVPKPVNMGVLQLRGDFVAGGESTTPATPPVINPAGHKINDEVVNAAPINGYGIQQQSQASDTIGVKLYADGKLRWVGAIRSEDPINLPSGYKAVQWEAEVSGTLSVFSLVLAGNRKELEQVP